MIKQLQRRFIKIAMLSFCIVVFLIVGLTNLLNYLRVRQEIEENLSVVLENLDVIQQTEKTGNGAMDGRIRKIATYMRKIRIQKKILMLF